MYVDIQKSLCKQMETLLRRKGFEGSWKADQAVIMKPLLIFDDFFMDLQPLSPKKSDHDDTEINKTKHENWELNNLYLIFDLVSSMTPHVKGKA